MKTIDQIKTRINEISKTDFFGFQTGDLVEALPFEDAKEYLKPEVTGEGWKYLKNDDEIKERIKDYLEFAWDKANNCRGLSAGRSMSHFAAWFWLLGDDEFASKLEDYTLYGKPYLVEISEKMDFDWKAHDNDHWCNSESDNGITAEQYFKNKAA